MFNVSIHEYFSVLNVFIVCIRNTAMFKLIPLLCTHVYLYMFSTVHPPWGLVQTGSSTLMAKWSRSQLLTWSFPFPIFSILLHIFLLGMLSLLRSFTCLWHLLTNTFMMTEQYWCFTLTSLIKLKNVLGFLKNYKFKVFDEWTIINSMH